MKVVIESELALEEPTAHQGLLTSFHVKVVAEGRASAARTIARTRLVRIHVAMSSNVGANLQDVLKAPGLGLEALYGEYFDEDWFQEQFTEGTGSDLLYVSAVLVEPEWQDRNLELALVRRLCDTLGQGCELAVIRYDAHQNVATWQKLGFRGNIEKGAGGFLHLPLGSRSTSVAAPRSGENVFQVLETDLD